MFLKKQNKKTPGVAEISLKQTQGEHNARRLQMEESWGTVWTRADERSEDTWCNDDWEQVRVGGASESGWGKSRRSTNRHFADQETNWNIEKQETNKINL